METLKPNIQNIVVTANLNTNIDLRKVACLLRNVEYDPKRFSAVIARIRKPKTTALIFNSGKIVVTAAKSHQDADLAVRKFGKLIQELGYDVKICDFKIQNIVASSSMNFTIHLGKLAVQHYKNCCYEPEIFPGLRYRMEKPAVTILIFISGKLIITGAKVEKDILEAFNIIYPIILNYKKSDSTH